MHQQIVSYEELFDHVKNNGVYLCEDVLTSYWLKYGGGYKRKGTFIEYSKNFIDFLHGYHSEQKSLKVSKFTECVDSVHFYDSVVVIEKKNRNKPQAEMSGNVSHTSAVVNPDFFTRTKRMIIGMVNRLLRFFRLPSIFWG
jgi:hypothetical protein